LSADSTNRTFFIPDYLKCIFSVYIHENPVAQIQPVKRPVVAGSFPRVKNVHLHIQAFWIFAFLTFVWVSAVYEKFFQDKIKCSYYKTLIVITAKNPFISN